MNALLEPWEDEALSDDISWGVAPPLKHQQQNAEAITDTAASAAQGTEAPSATADGGQVAAVDGTAATSVGAGGGGGRGAVSGLAALHPGQELDLGVSYHGQKVRSHIGAVLDCWVVGWLLIGGHDPVLVLGRMV